MAEAHGIKARFWIGSTDLSGYLQSVEVGGEADTAEVSTLSDTNKRYVVGLQDATFSLEGNFDPAFDLVLSNLFAATAGTAFKYFPQGSVSGLPLYSGSVYISTYSKSASTDDAGKATVEFVPSSAVTRGTV